MSPNKVGKKVPSATQTQEAAQMKINAASFNNPRIN